MIHLITGLPGAGKSLYALWSVRRLADESGRQVYYYGIKDLNIPGWIEMGDPLRWYELPIGSIFLIDECQSVFRPRRLGSDVPQYIAAFETHRHGGLDAFLITQHPGLVDTNIRRLVGCHTHVVRAFGSRRAVLHSWGEVNEQPQRSRKNSEQKFWSYPKEVFSWYKSAELHTVKMKLPFRVWLLIPLVVIFAGCIWVVVNYYRSSKESPVGSSSATSAQVATGHVTPVASGGARDTVLTRDQYVASLVPRVDGFPHTAPRYDSVTQPDEAPYPVGCIESKKNGCRCFSQQGTPISMTETMCRSILTTGFFRDWGHEEKRSRDRREVVDSSSGPRS